MFKQFWNSLSAIGVQEQYSDKLIKRVMLTNQFSFIAMVVVIISGINNYLLGDAFSALLIELIAIFCLFGFWLNHTHHHSTATSFFLLIMSLTVFYFDSYSGFDSGTYLHYFPVILAIGFVFDFEDKKLLLFHFLLILAFLIINVLTDHKLFENHLLTEEVKHKMFIANLLFSCFAIGFFMYLSISNNIRESAIFEQRINERKANELVIKQALHEKDILMAEIHHRVKNNLAIIASLFNLQISTVENEEAKEILMESKNRVKSMAIIHDRLYKSDSISRIDFGKYTAELVDEIKYSYPTLAKNIKVKAEISNVTLTVNDAIPCGLILNELLTNCYKHAFTGRESGIIDIRLIKEDGTIRLSVKDNGLGLKEGYDQTDSLGMVVIQSLSEQLDGKYSFTVDKGTHFQLEF